MSVRMMDTFITSSRLELVASKALLNLMEACVLCSFKPHFIASLLSAAGSVCGLSHFSHEALSGSDKADCLNLDHSLRGIQPFYLK